MSDVYIVGAGIHPFGRHEGTGLDLGVAAARQALGDSDLEWADIQCAFGGSSAAGNADAMLPRMGLTGIQFINVANGCATGGSAVLASGSNPPINSGRKLGTIHRRDRTRAVRGQLFINGNYRSAAQATCRLRGATPPPERQLARAGPD